jgi:hypothetical protein
MGKGNGLRNGPVPVVVRSSTFHQAFPRNSPSTWPATANASKTSGAYSVSAETPRVRCRWNPLGAKLITLISPAANFLIWTAALEGNAASTQASATFLKDSSFITCDVEP